MGKETEQDSLWLARQSKTLDTRSVLQELHLLPTIPGSDKTF